MGARPRRPCALLPLPASLPPARRAGRLLRHPRQPRRPAGGADLRPAGHRARGPHREEAALPLPARHATCSRWAPPAATCAASSARTGSCRAPRPDRATRPRPAARGGRRAGRRAGLPVHRLHLQRAHHLGRVRVRRGRRGARARRRHRAGDQRLRHARGLRRPVRGRRRRQRGPQGDERGLLPPPHAGAARAGARDAAPHPPRDATPGWRSPTWSSPRSTTGRTT